MSRPSEHALIACHFAPLVAEGPARGLMDDVAVLGAPEGRDLVLTTDALVAGVHFFADDPPGAIAAKALRVNLSDLAAKGAEPTGFLLTLMLPGDCDEAWIAGFAAGLRADIAEFAVPLLGGDTVSTPGPLSISVTAIGTVPRGRAPARAGARIGDIVFVSGTVGDAALGLDVARGAAPDALQPDLAAMLLDRYRMPRPRLALRAAILAHANATMDVSDGLVGDLDKLCRAAGTGADIDAARVPLSDAARAWLALKPDALAAILTGGDDYEVLATVCESKAEAFARAASDAGCPVTAIGRITAGSGTPPVVRGPDGAPLAFSRLSYAHD